MLEEILCEHEQCRSLISSEVPDTLLEYLVISRSAVVAVCMNGPTPLFGWKRWTWNLVFTFSSVKCFCYSFFSAIPSLVKLGRCNLLLMYYSNLYITHHFWEVFPSQNSNSLLSPCLLERYVLCIFKAFPKLEKRIITC